MHFGAAVPTGWLILSDARRISATGHTGLEFATVTDQSNSANFADADNGLGTCAFRAVIGLFTVQ